MGVVEPVRVSHSLKITTEVAMQLGFNPNPTFAEVEGGTEHSNLSLSREGVLSRYWLQTYQYQRVPRAQKPTKEKAAASRFGKSGFLPGLLSAMFR